MNVTAALDCPVLKNDLFSSTNRLVLEIWPKIKDSLTQRILKVQRKTRNNFCLLRETTEMEKEEE